MRSREDIEAESAALRLQLDDLRALALADASAGLTEAEGNASYSPISHNHTGVYQPLATPLTNTTAAFTTAQETKLAGIAADAEVNVNADWSASSGDAQILNKPTLGGAAALNVGTTAGTVAAGDHSHSGLAPTGGTTGQVLKKVSNTNYDYSWQADATGGGGSVATASIPFTNGDTVQRVTVNDAAVSDASNLLASLRRPNQADASADPGYVYMLNIVRQGSGSFDVQVVCLDHSGNDPTEIPPNETVTLTYSVA